jgi:glycosyltransferase involved in cell wall biosynthesis
VIPAVSVVMAVRDGGERLSSSIESILAQDVALELICVDDGSVDDSWERLVQLASRDARLRPLRQAPEGITRALIRGCAAARAGLIARQDAGDVSLPGRLRAQITLMESSGGAVLASCGTRFVGPRGELLYEVIRTGEQMSQSYRDADLHSLHGVTHHGSVLFRRDAYEAVGGYRAAFEVAQDLDLWLRLSEQGEVRAVPRVLYEARVEPRSISGLWRSQQIRAAKIALASAQRRRGGVSDGDLIIDNPSLRRSSPGRLRRAWLLAQSSYFIGACLRREPAHARPYFRAAIRSFPFHARAWLALGTSYLHS